MNSVKVERIEWKGEIFELPGPIYVDLDDLRQKFPGRERDNMVTFLYLKSIKEWIRKE